jgi:hemolysin III
MPSRGVGCRPGSPASGDEPAGEAAASLRLAERWADLSVLVGGLALGTGGAIALLAATLARGDTRMIIAIGIYVAGLLAMLGSSLAYHAAAGSPHRPMLRRLDHAAIFAMIAGTATPFALARRDTLWGAAVALAIWAAAAIGIVAKLRAPIGIVAKLRAPIGGIRRSAVAYLLLGWLSAVAVGPSLSAGIALRIAAGGVLYTVGVGFYLWRRLPFHSAIWHGLVLAGAACHFLAIVDGVVFA